MSMKVSNELKVYEVDGEESKLLDGPALMVDSHWNYREMVVLTFSGKSITVSSEDLIRAVQNAMNWK